MQEGQNARQQVVERIRQSTSILVAVGNNPSVDSLAASLGLSLMLNKMNKHATAVFSGQTPAAIKFLEPNKTFENSVDALRDFIISLDKEKADRLRYKVEDDVVRIFITPYKTSISEKDLQYSQGDFNVELIIALGVEKREDLDKAIVAHGRILHDATVVTVNANSQHSTLGAIDWNDAAASSLCEMLVGLGEAFQQPGLLDEQISTALLTGIVAETDRFSNPRTSPRVMTMAAQLMAAGANQQLIATNLEEAKAIAAPAPQNTAPVAKQASSETPQPMPQEPVQKKDPGELDIVHEKKPVSAQAEAEKELEAALPAPQVEHNLLPELKEDIEAATKEIEKPAAEPNSSPKAPGSDSVNDNAKKDEADNDYISTHGSWKGKRLEPPTLGGTLNATTEQAMESSKQAEEADRNTKLLTHPEDAAQQGQGKKRNRRRGGNKQENTGESAPVAAAAVTSVAPEVALAPEAAPAVSPAPAPVEQPSSQQSMELPPEPVAPAPLPEPQLPELPPIPPEPQLPPAPEAPEQTSAVELAPAPVPEPLPAPEPIVTPSAPEPVSEPEPVVPDLIPAPDDLEVLHKEAEASAAAAAAAAQPAESVAGDLDTARQAVTQALDAQPFNPAGQPLASVGAQPLPAMPSMPVAEPQPQDSGQPLPPPAPMAPSVPAPMAPESVIGDLPPMPPMPPLPANGTDLPPAPDLPGLNAPLPAITDTPPAAPDAQPPVIPPADPGQFKIPGA